MHLIAILFQWLLGFFTGRLAACKAPAPGHRDARGRSPSASEHDRARRTTNFGWMNVASVFDERPAPPGWEGPAPRLDPRPRRSG